MKKFILILFLNIPILMFSQKEANHWYFGEYAGLDFSSGVPVFDSNSVMRSFESSSSISDSSGNLLFYSNGGDVVILSTDTMRGVVCNRNHQIMPNGILKDTCSYQSFQTSIIIPKVGDINKFYLFTLDHLYSMNKGLRYSIIDMSLDGGNGDVSQKGVLVLDSLLVGMSATLHTNGIDYWLVVERRPPGTWTGLVNYYAYKISASGISAPVITPEDPMNSYANGSTKFSPDGNLFYSSQGLYNFNKTTGQLSGFRTLGNGVYDCAEFSPNSNILYVTYMGSTAFYINQFDLNATDIPSSRTVLDSGINYYSYSWKGGMQLGPDGKIYVSMISDTISVINNPNSIGISCNYAPHSFALAGRNSWFEFPNFPSNYFSNVFGSNGITNILNTSSFTLYPNPCSTEATLTADIFLHNATINIFNCYGQKVKEIKNISSQKATFLCDNLSNGIYFVHLIADNKILAVKKILITN